MKEITITEKDKCFLCGRTSKDYEIIRTKVVEELDSDISKLLKDKEIESERLKELLRIGSTIDEKHKELTMNSITTELNTYAKIYPGIEKVAQFYHNEIGHSKRNFKLAEVLAHIENNGSKEMKRIQDVLEHMPDSTKEKERNLFLENRIVQLSPGTIASSDFRITYEISLCPICNQIIKNLEKGIQSMR
jgi:hypothetical protein